MKLTLFQFLLPMLMAGNLIFGADFAPVQIFKYQTPRHSNTNGAPNPPQVVIQANNYSLEPPATPFVPGENHRTYLLGTNTIPFPFKIAAVETPDAREKQELKDQALALLQARDYDGLDALAEKYRSSRESYADGAWKLNDVYAGLNLPDQSPDAEWGARISALRDWILAKPESITARVTLAEVLVNYAWKARGPGMADTVSTEGWRLFGQRLREGVGVLADAGHLKQKCPRYWLVLMWAGVGLEYNKTQLNAVFNRAIDFEPQFETYYNRRAFYLLPRWYGEKGETEKDLTRSCDLIGGENGDMLYAQVAWYLHQVVGYPNVFKQYDLSWPRIDRGFDTIEKRFPDSLAAKNERAHLAVLASDYGKACDYFNQTQGKVDLSVWESVDQYKSFLILAFRMRH